MKIRHQLYVAAALAAVATAALLLGLAQAMRINDAGLRQQATSQDMARDIGSLLTLTNEFAAYGGDRAAAQWRLRHAQLLATAEAAIQGLGVSLGNPHLLEEAIASGLLVLLFPDLLTGEKSYCWVRPARAAQDPASVAFCDWLAAA